jgi:hypothetical protein
MAKIVLQSSNSVVVPSLSLVLRMPPVLHLFSDDSRIPQVSEQ